MSIVLVTYNYENDGRSDYILTLCIDWKKEGPGYIKFETYMFDMYTSKSLQAKFNKLTFTTFSLKHNTIT